MSDRIPVPLEGLTATLLSDGRLAIDWPNGNLWAVFDEKWLTDRGFAVPKPPRVGPCGLTEADTRWVAGPSGSVASVSVTAKDDESRVRAHLIRECRAVVAEWDAESAGGVADTGRPVGDRTGSRPTPDGAA